MSPFYTDRPDLARSYRSQSEGLRRVRTRRPLNDNVPTPGWHIEGAITVGRQIGPHLLRIYDDHPEHKELLGFNAWLLSGGPVVIQWTVNAGVLLESHTISSGVDNEVLLPEPYIVENGETGGEFLRPVISSVTGTPTAPLCLFFYARTVPI